jgi:hypothetical protein
MTPTQNRRRAVDPPPLDPLTPFHISVPVSLAARIHDYARAHGLSKAAAARTLMLAGLAADPDGQIDGQTRIGGED